MPDIRPIHHGQLRHLPLSLNIEPSPNALIGYLPALKRARNYAAREWLALSRGWMPAATTVDEL